MKLIKRIQDRIRVNREAKRNRREDRKEKRADILSTISAYVASILFIISLIAALLGIYRHYKPSTVIDQEQIIDSQSVKYGKTIVSKVNGIHDGDTLNVDIKDWPPIVGKSMPVRINKIDAPEITTKDAALKSLAVKARDFIKTQVDSGKVIELRNIQRDKYFRLNADLIIDNIDIAQELLKKGLVKPYDGGKKSPWE